MSENWTRGDWRCDPLDEGRYGSRTEPPDPGGPAIIWSETEHGGICVATLDDPVYRVDPVDAHDDGVRLCGDQDSNGQLMAAAPAMYDALKPLAAISIEDDWDDDYAIHVATVRCGRYDYFSWKITAGDVRAARAARAKARGESE